MINPFYPPLFREDFRTSKLAGWVLTLYIGRRKRNTSAMGRDTILFDINETILDLSSLRPMFKAAFGSEGASAIWFSDLLHSHPIGLRRR